MEGNGTIPPAPMDPPGKETLDKVARDSNRIVAFIALVMSTLVVFVVLGGGLVLYSQYRQLQSTEQSLLNTRQLQQQGKKSTCDFYAVIGTSPVVASGPKKSSPALIRLIHDSRTTFEKRRCGTLPAPSPALIQLGDEYKFPVSN